MNIKGEVAFITGGGGAIGAEIGLQLSQRGVAVALVDMNGPAAEAVAQQIRQAGGKSLGLSVDVTDKESVEKAVSRTQDVLGAIDILVNCAGIYPHSLVMEMSEAEWDRVVDIILKGTFLTCRAILPGMKQRRYGKIVNIGSNHAFKGGSTAAHYSAAKAGVVCFTKSLALEMASDGINVNTISPGITDTPMPHSVLSDAALIERAKKIPMGRLAMPRDIADAVAFLVSEESRYITGQTLCVNGGDLMP
jgi:NAD(P)-dependent dehydrogenase (short-subunit alcohol dehydrogenase family)